MTIKTTFAALAMTMIIASPAFAAETGTAVKANIAPVQVQAGADAKTDTIKAESGTEVVQPQSGQIAPAATIDSKLEHKDMIDGKKLDKNGKELPLNVKSESTAIVK